MKARIITRKVFMKLTKLSLIYASVRKYGFLWALLYIIYRLFGNANAFLKELVRKIELHNHVVSRFSVLSESHTREWNRSVWNAYDWSSAGNEWTRDVRRFRNLDPERWKSKLVHKYLYPFIGKNSVVLEIGPGAGRWTRVIAPKVKSLYVLDISEVALAKCKKRLSNFNNIYYMPVMESMPQKLRRNSIDFVWSYDVFVHINPHDINEYLILLHRVMKLGAKAVIHHAGDYSDCNIRNMGLRSWMNSDFFLDLSQQNKFKIITQDKSIAHFPGDVLTVLEK